MQVTCSLVKWHEFVDWIDQGSPMDACLSAIQRPANWDNDGHSSYHELTKLHESLRPSLNEANREVCSTSFDVLCRDEGIDDLKSDHELLRCYILRLNPNRVCRMSQGLAAFDYSDFRRVFDSHWPVENRKRFMTFDELMEYIAQWRSAIDEAAGAGRGILVLMG